MDSSASAMTGDEKGKSAIAIKGDGDKVQKRTHNSDLEEIVMNSMVDQVGVRITVRSV